jgi:CPA1 family monovalent cation:H+ antiporter
LRPLLRLLGLDKLGPTERALREGAIGVALAEAREKVLRTVAAEGLDPAVAEGVMHEIAPATASPTTAQRGAPSGVEAETDMAAVALSTLTQHEAELCHRRLREGTVSRRTAEARLADTGRFMDGIKQAGAEGYVRAAERALAFPRRFRWAILLQQRLGIERPLAELLSERFDRLFISSIMLADLAEFLRRRVRPVVGAGAAAAAEALLERRREGVGKALAALRLQYPDYARQLEELYVGRLALRLVEDGYRSMRAESVVSEEVFDDLMRGLAARRRALSIRPRLDMAMAPEAMLGRVHLFRGLSEEARRRIARMMRPRLALPGEPIVRAGERGDAMFFIATGAVEVALTPPIRLGSGEFFGEIALVTNRPRIADVVALAYSSLLVLTARDLERLSAADPEIGREIAAVARARIAAADPAAG